MSDALLSLVTLDATQMETPYVVAILLGMLGTYAATIGGLFWLLKASWERNLADKEREIERRLKLEEMDRQMKEETGRKKSYAEMAAEAIAALQAVSGQKQAAVGVEPLPTLAKVVSESHSPSTAEQRETAEIATLRAKLAAIKLVEGLPPREEPAHAPEGAPAVMPAPAGPLTIEVSADVVNVQQKEKE